MNILWVLCLVAVVCAALQPARAEAEAGAVAETDMEAGPGLAEPSQRAPEGEEEGLEADVEQLLLSAQAQPALEVLGGAVSLERAEGAAREGRAEGASLGERFAAFLRSRVLRLRLPGATGDVEEGRGRLKRLLVPFMILLELLLTGVVFPIFASSIGLVALKGLYDGAAAGLIAAVVGLTELVQNYSRPPRVTLVRPQVPIEHVYHAPVDLLHHGAHGWSRTASAQAAAVPAAVDPYRGYGPSAPAPLAPVGPAAPAVGTTWHLRPVRR